MHRAYQLVLHPLVRYLLAWLVAINVAGVVFASAWNAFAAPTRRDGNNGHAMIDFGGQWLMGRMLAEGRGRQLYDRNQQRRVLNQAYPWDDEVPWAERSSEEPQLHDAEDLMVAFMGHDDPTTAQAGAAVAAGLAAGDPFSVLVLSGAIQQDVESRVRAMAEPHRGGPLYPPVHGLLLWPLGTLTPHQAYRVMQILGMLLALVAALGIRQLSGGLVWWPVAFTAILLYPCFYSTLSLGQNSIFSLTVLIWGWALMTRGRPGAGGAMWGLLAFKPTWAAAFFLVPVLTGRWRGALAMLGAGVALAAATLPFVGWQSWLDWLRVGNDASSLYSTDHNWVFLSRDLLGISRRWLLDFKNPPSPAIDLAATLCGWALVLLVVECTLRTAVFRNDRARVATGTGAAFLFLGAWLSCFHFMYYDVLLTALPVLLLLMEPGPYFRPRYVTLLVSSSVPGGKKLERYLQLRQPDTYPASKSAAPPDGWGGVWVCNSLTLSLLAFLLVSEFILPAMKLDVLVSSPFWTGGPIPLPIRFSTSVFGTPWSTFCLLALWLWCGWLWLQKPVIEAKAPRTESGDAPKLAAVPRVDAPQLV